MVELRLFETGRCRIMIHYVVMNRVTIAAMQNKT